MNHKITYQERRVQIGDAEVIRYHADCTCHWGTQFMAYKRDLDIVVVSHFEAMGLVEGR